MPSSDARRWAWPLIGIATFPANVIRSPFDGLPRFRWSMLASISFSVHRKIDATPEAHRISQSVTPVAACQRRRNPEVLGRWHALWIRPILRDRDKAARAPDPLISFRISANL